MLNRLDMNTEDYLNYSLIENKKLYERNIEVNSFLNDTDNDLDIHIVFRFCKLEELIEETEQEMRDIRSCIEKESLKVEMLGRLNKQYTTEFIKLENSINTNSKNLYVKMCEFEELKSMLFEIVEEFDIKEIESDDPLVFFK